MCRYVLYIILPYWVGRKCILLLTRRLAHNYSLLAACVIILLLIKLELNYAFNFGVQFLFPTLQAHLGWGKTFAMFATFLGGAIFYIQGVVPETTGLTLEEIQNQLNGPSGGHEDDDRTHKHLTTIKNNTTNTAAYPTEETHLLATVMSTSSCTALLGAHPSLEEMETQLMRTSSGSALHAMMEKS